MNDSLIDKVLSVKQAGDASRFSPREALRALFSHLTDRERDVILRRHGLHGGTPETLEHIGTSLEVTRERIRQIERAALGKLRSAEDIDAVLQPAEALFAQHLDHAGGATTVADIVARASGGLESGDDIPTVLSFLLHQLLHDRFQYITNDQHLEDAWAHRTFDLTKARVPIVRIIEFFEESKEPKTLESIHANLLERHSDRAHSKTDVEMFLRLARHIGQNPFGEYGLMHWPTIRPKRMTDKIYLVLKHHGKPLHFNELTERVNAAQFDQKRAHAPTIHNELIMDDRYILVGRGLYALASWGFKPGLVADVIASVLSDAGSPLSRQEIVEKVLRERLVGKATIHLALANTKRFTRLSDGRYTVASAPAAVV